MIYVLHVIVFFIFLVSNIGGGLTPLGDPPLFLGFLKGVTFFWTAEHLAGPMLLAVIVLLGLLYAAAGLICLQNPFEAATFLTLLLGISLIVGGLIRVFLATRMGAGTPWGWVALSGVLSFLLGLMIVAKWPASSFYVLGILLGVDLIFVGSTWLTVGLALRKGTKT